MRQRVRRLTSALPIFPSEKDDFIRRDDVWLTACSVSAVSSLECASSPQDWAKRLCLSMPTPLPDYRMVSGLDG